MRRSSPRPRWLRRTLVCTPPALSAAGAAAVVLAQPTWIGFGIAVLCLLAVAVEAELVREELRADRHATPSMAQRYRLLARLLDAADDREVRVDPAHRYSILLQEERLADGSLQRSLLRFDQDELERAGHDGVSTPLVFDHFSLDPARPLVRHRFGAVTVTRDAEGRARVIGIPEPHRDRQAMAEIARLLASTAADIPPLEDLDVLIAQIRSASALASDG
ncbi:hypothetical protein [Lentzea sp. NPDC060358]|uniref:hypothetical protein n=1 Tax=Lentzea sp. NPDC060358 TaxID=3347103 RepID=UPI00364F8E37